MAISKAQSVILSAFMVASCGLQHTGKGISLTESEVFLIRDGNNIEYVAELILNNETDKKLCVMDDIFVNQYSPYAIVDSIGQISSLGAPHPPLTSEIVEIQPRASRSFRRVVVISSFPISSDEQFEVTIEAAFCEDMRRFSRTARINASQIIPN